MQKSLEIPKKQQRHVLSAKIQKRKPQSTFKNILAQPFPRYWPQIDGEQCKQFFEMLHLIREKNGELFSTKKSKSKHPITCGLQSSIRKLKNGHVNTLIISADLKPRYVVNQIILLALARNELIRILCVPNLAQRFNELLTFPCFACVITDNNEIFAELNKWMDSVVSEHYPVPAPIKSYFDARRQRQKCIASSSDKVGNSMTNKNGAKAAYNEVNFNDLYLSKDDKGDNRRMFSPKNAIDLKPLSLAIASLAQVKSDFISLNAYDVSESQPTAATMSTSKHKKKRKWKDQCIRAENTSKSVTPMTAYQTLTIKKIQGNAKKVKKQKKAKYSMNKNGGEDKKK